MNPLPHVTFILEDFVERSAGQQLLDRFLIGYNHNGEFVSPAARVTLFAEKVSNREALEARVKDFGLIVAPSLEQAVANGQFVVIVPGSSAALINPALATRALQLLPNGARCWLYGVASTTSIARDLAALAQSRALSLATGTAASAPFQLPEIPAQDPSKIRKALVVAVGEFPLAEIEALEGLRSLFSTPPKNHSVPHVRPLRSHQVWTAAYSAEWSNLFAAALSRSNTMQGDPELDGRTQDIAGLHLVEKLASQPRGWLLTDSNGSSILILVLDGAVQDFNVAFELSGGRALSTQLYRPPAPMLDHFSLFGAQVHSFLQGTESPRIAEEIQVLPGIIEAMNRSRNDQV